MTTPNKEITPEMLDGYERRVKWQIENGAAELVSTPSTILALIAAARRGLDPSHNETLMKLADCGAELTALHKQVEELKVRHDWLLNNLGASGGESETS